jgi:metal-dependent HD superfamily phosphatase/phosphodiesterase
MENNRRILEVPSRHNPKLQQLLNFIDIDEELTQLWKCANINAVDRLGMSDHGEVHIRIVANAALSLIRLLIKEGVVPNAVSDHGLDNQDAEVLVVLAACLHDLGMAVHRQDHESYSLILAYPKARAILAGIYGEPALTKMVAETLHAVIAHRWDVPALTLEAGVLKVADALDMTEGRSRIPFEAGEINIHSVSAQAVDDVKIEKGSERPVRVNILLNNSAGIFQVDELLRRKLQNSPVEPYIEVVAHIEGEKERRLIEFYNI